VTKTIKVREPDGPVVDAALGPDVDLSQEDVRDSRGRRVTDDYADAVVERVYRAVGRPSLSGRGRSPRVTFRLPDDLRAEAERRAKRDGTTVSRLAREAFERFLRAS
jgi:hypothetical protein